MTQEDKELLLKDLCARLPYGVKVQVADYRTPVELSHINIKSGNGRKACCFVFAFGPERVKPYLRPMSSMTKEEKKEYDNFLFDNLEREDVIGYEDKAFGIDSNAEIVTKTMAEVDPVTGEVTKELTNHGIPQIDLEVNGIWYVKDGSLTHAAFPELVEYGSYMNNQVVNKAIIFPSVMEIGKWAFKDTPSMLEVYLNPECKRYDTSFPEECVVKDWPLSARVTQMPTKTTYNVGEDFDVSGMKVLVTLDMSVMGKDYGSYAYEANNDYFTVVQFDNTSPGEKVVILRYKTPYSVGQYSVVLPEPVIVV